ncbi:MAG: M42 family peptidase, partial [Candidatus Diapherotrites archaeon]|nr:M42 family peptidase [Candidatus Diapherotrites archaeon]
MQCGGYLCRNPGHITPPQLLAKAKLDWEDVFVDIGARNADEVKTRGVNIGNAVIWNPPTRRIGQLITGKAMDDRAGLAIMTELLPHLRETKLKYRLFFASTIQEEMGLIGGGSLERNERFDFAITLDVGLAGDVPGITDQEMPVHVGCGPV